MRHPYNFQYLTEGLPFPWQWLQNSTSSPGKRRQVLLTQETSFIRKVQWELKCLARNFVIFLFTLSGLQWWTWAKLLLASVTEELGLSRARLGCSTHTPLPIPVLARDHKWTGESAAGPCRLPVNLGCGPPHWTRSSYSPTWKIWIPRIVKPRVSEASISLLSCRNTILWKNMFFLFNSAPKKQKL